MGKNGQSGRLPGFCFRRVAWVQDGRSRRKDTRMWMDMGGQVDSLRIHRLIATTDQGSRPAVLPKPFDASGGALWNPL